MNESVLKVAGDYFPQIIAAASISLFIALLVGLVVGIRMRKQILTQAAEELLSTPQFAAAAKVEADKAIRSVPFQEAVQRTIRDDVRTQSGIISVILKSEEIREFVDRRVQHGQNNFGYVVDAKIREAQEQTRKENIESTKRLEEKIDQALDLLIQHVGQSGGRG